MINMSGEFEVKGAAAAFWAGLLARRCDTCKTAPAILYCRSDTVYLCGPCDTRIHGSIRHERVWMCEVCEQAPAAVTCKADAAALCVACDADIHSANPLARRHDRIPVVPFFDPVDSALKAATATAGAGCATLAAGHVAGFLFGDAVEDESESGAAWLMPNNGFQEMKQANHHVFSDSYLDLEYGNSLDSVVPVTAGAALGAPAPATYLLPETVGELDFARSKISYGSFTAGHSISHSISSSEVGVVPDGSMADVTNPYGAVARVSNPAVAHMDREARVMRYREKRKNRKFEKTIRYASRKAYAETRPRIKGRFAKRTEIEPEMDRVYASSVGVSGFMVEGYGVVPSF